MTGFGRAEGEADIGSFVWELRAVNGKGLDVRLRLPPGFDHIETSARKLISNTLSRGNVQVSLNLTQRGESSLPQLNEDVLGAVLRAVDTIESKAACAPSTAAALLSVRGVFEPQDRQPSAEQREALANQLLDGLKSAVVALDQARLQEGQALNDILSKNVSTIEQLTIRAEADPSLTSEAIAQRVRDQLARIDSGQRELDRERLHQEVALLATKADIREELDRLAAHGRAARLLLSEGSPAGRKLEFLAQEFNRECNTLCSKSQAVSLTEIGLELKVVIDQFREQILNVE